MLRARVKREPTGLNPRASSEVWWFWDESRGWGWVLGSPDGCAARGVVGDVTECGELVGTIGDRGDLEAFGPDTTGACERAGGECSGGAGLGESYEVADVGVDGLIVSTRSPRVGTRGLLWEQESREDVEVMVVNGARDHFDPLIDQRGDEFFAGDRSRLCR